MDAIDVKTMFLEMKDHLRRLIYWAGLQGVGYTIWR